MTARELICLNIVVAAVAVTTWFVLDLGNTSQVLIFNEPVSHKLIIKEVLKTREEDTDMTLYDQSLQNVYQELDIPEQQTINEQDLSQTHFDNRTQVLDNLYEQFNALETQYGVLSIDDIALLEDSLDEIDQDNMLADLSYALDELLIQQ